MNNSIALRPAQSLSLTAATTSTSARIVRAALLGGLAVLGSFGTTMAQDITSVKAKQADSQNLWLTVENPSQKWMHMQVLSLTENTCLIDESNRKSSYGSKLNFNGLPAGNYAVLLTVGREHYRYDVQVQSQAQTTITIPGITPDNTSVAVASAKR